MSLISRKALVAAGIASMAVAGATATSAQANFQKTLTYNCIYPYLSDAQPLKVEIDAVIPATVPAKTRTDAFVINAKATAGGLTSSAVALIGATTIEGKTAASSTVAPTGSAAIPLVVPIIVPKQTVPAEGDIILNASGTTPRITIANPGPAKITVDSIALTLIARDADGVAIPLEASATPVPQTDDDPDTFQVSCKLAPATQDTTLAVIQVTDGTSTPAPTTNPTPVPTTNPTPVPTTNPTPVPTTNPTPVPTTNPTPVPTTGPTPVPTTVPTPGPTPVDSLIKYSYSLAGSATLKTLTKGSLPLSGGINAQLGLPSGNFEGDLSLAQSKGKLTALGFLPVDATVDLVSTDKVRGSLKNGKLTAVAKVRIKLPSVKTLGIELAGGANCQAKQISSITLNSTQDVFKPLSGGPIAGTFSISDLSGCGFLTGIVSPLTAGSGNLIALNLTPRPVNF